MPHGTPEGTEQALLYAYCAGFIDADGCIMLTVYKSKHWRQMRVCVDAYNRKPEPLQLLKQLFGGSLYYRKPRDERWAGCWCWRVQGNEAHTCLTALLPYLRIKQEQAKVALAAEAIRQAEWKRVDAVGGCGSEPYSEEAWAQYLSLKEHMHWLNRKGG
ncbi:unnamed protein product [marine sediment metagenome]|uniref:Homing endonuclease LAGLIDADG domain-containing protein n=1 Tax=marine sediment metagenome TaxID=412755 RepID=X1PZP4_9ZZZZ